MKYKITFESDRKISQVDLSRVVGKLVIEIGQFEKCQKLSNFEAEEVRK
jgi:hypothetical protein